jgi:hypothetical protein
MRTRRERLRPTTLTRALMPFFITTTAAVNATTANWPCPELFASTGRAAGLSISARQKVGFGKAEVDPKLRTVG